MACWKRCAVELGKPQRFQNGICIDGELKKLVHYNAEMVMQPLWWEESRTNDGPLHTDVVSYQAYYLEVGEAHYMGKDLTEVRSPQR